MAHARRIGVLAVLATAGMAAADPTFHTVALSGSQAPGLPAGVTFSFFSDPRVNTAGRIAFWADLAGPDVTSANSNSIWTDREGTLAMALRQGNPAPFGIDIVWGAIPSPAFNSAGRLAFTASLLNRTTPGPTSLGIFTYDPGAVTVAIIAREGYPWPGLPVNFANLPPATLSSTGALAFSSNTGAGLWTAQPVAGPLIQAIAGQQAPGAPAGVLFGSLEDAVIGSGGWALFRASTTTGGTTPIIGTGLWTTTDNAPSPVMVGGSPAPGLPAGVTLAEFSLQPSRSGINKEVHWARVTGPGITPANEGLIYASLPTSGAAIVARSGDPAPGAAPGVTFGRLGRHPVVSASGHVAASGSLASGSAGAGSGVWIMAPGEPLIPVALSGQQAPRLPQGVTFAGFNEPTLNDAGQVAFLARLTGPGVTTTNNWALYAADSMGRLYPIVRTGDLFDVGSGSPRLVDEIIFDSPGPESGYSAFAAVGPSGVLTFKLVFRDSTQPPATALSSGVFTATIRCLPDLSNSGAIAVDDFILFLNNYAAENLRACDYSGNGLLGVDDFIYFLNAVAVGCR